jgi:iron complex outermembrane receptor protein
MVWQGFGRRDERVSLVLAAAMGAMAFGAEAPAAAHARMQASQLAAEVRSYAIPAGTVGMALNRLAEENGVQMVFLAGLTRDVRTGGLKGDYTLGAALDALLAGTGLSYRLADDEREVFIVLAQNDAVRNDTSGAEALPPIDIGAARPQAQAGRDVGSGTKGGIGYSVPRAASATKTDTPIKETPVSIQVVPRDVIEDQKAYRVQDALENVSGVQPRGSLGGYRERYIVRGFSSGENFYRNGLRVTTSGFTSNFETASLDRIDVVKGGGSVLYGRGEPSGSILFWTKTPRDHAFYSFEQDFGSYGYYRTNWDFGAPLDDDGSLAYRFSGAYADTKSFRDFGQSQNFVFYPTLRWRPTQDTEINLGLEVANQDFRADYGVVALGNLPAPIPISRSLGEPIDPNDNNRTVNLDFSVKHQIDESWTITNRFLASFRHSDNVDIAPLGHGSGVGSLNPDLVTLDRQAAKQYFDQASYSTNLDLVGKFETFGARHTTLVGVDYFNDDSVYLSGGTSSIGIRYPINIYFPVYGRTPAAFGAPTQFFDDTKESWFGVYFQDQITLWDRVHILGGGRQDWVDVWNTNLRTNSVRKQTVGAFSPRVGLLIDLAPWLSAYANWSETFGANNGRDASGNQLAPQTGQQYEFGFKGQTEDGALQATLALFDVKKQNIPTRDLRFPFSNVQALIGEIHSRGVEFDLSGRIVEGLDAIVAFAYTDARLEVDGGGNQGHRVQGVPATSGRLWLKYEFPKDSLLSGFTIGGGPYVVSNRAGNNANDFSLPGFARLDLMASYRTTLWNVPVTAQLNVKNALNQRYYESADTSNASPRVSIAPGQPLTFIGSIRVQF